MAEEGGGQGYNGVHGTSPGVLPGAVTELTCSCVFRFLSRGHSLSKVVETQPSAFHFEILNLPL